MLTDKRGTGMAVVLVGSPISGYRVFGPFKTFDEAEEWAGGVTEAWAAELEAQASWEADL